MGIRTRDPKYPPWSDLPIELLTAIAKTLTANPLHILTFRSVCKSWRNSFSPPPQPPFLSPLLPLTVPSPPFLDRHGKQSSITVTVIYSIRCPVNSSVSDFSPCENKSWFLFLDEFTPGELSLCKPFRRYHYPIPVNFPKTINLIDDFNAIELSRFYSLSYSSESSDDPRFIGEELDKVVLFPNKLVALALFGEGYLAIIRFNCGNDADDDGVWTIIHYKRRGFRFDDIVEFKGRVLGIDRRARVYEIGCDSSEIKPVVPPIAGGGGRRKRLVESLGLLYMVVRCNADTGKTRVKECEGEGEEEVTKTKFKVYALDEGRNKWVEITSLGDRSFIFGIDFSFSASAKELDTCGKNCILFNRQCFLCYNTKDDDAELFNKSEESFLDVVVCHLNDAVHCDVIESYPGYSDMLWPPPPWIWPVDRLTRLEMLETSIDGILQRLAENIKSMVKDQTSKEAGDSPDNFQQQAVLKEGKIVLKLKERVISYQKFEPNFMREYDIYKILKEAASILGLQKSTYMLNSLYKLVLQARRFSNATGERPGRPYELQSFTDNNPLSEVLLPFLLQRDGIVFIFEELVTRLEKFPKAQFSPIQTG